MDKHEKMVRRFLKAHGLDPWGRTRREARAAKQDLFRRCRIVRNGMAGLSRQKGGGR